MFRLARVAVAVALVLSPSAAWACGMMVSAGGTAEIGGLESLLRWDDGREELLTVVDYYGGGGEEFAWLMPLPSIPEISEGDADPITAALEITEPPDRDDHVPDLIPSDEGEGAVGGGVDVLDRATVGNLRFVTLGAADAGEVTAWMTEHGFGFHDRQEPVLQGYLERDWVVVAARILPGVESEGALVPVRFGFEAAEPVYPLAIAGAGHPEQTIPMTLFTVTPYRPTSTTFDERVVRPDDHGHFDVAGPALELRYAARLDAGDAQRLDAEAGRWLTRYEATWDAETLTDDLVLERAPDQAAIDFRPLLDEYGSARRMVYLGRTALIAIPLILVGVVVLLLIRRARRRAAEAG